MMGTYHKLAEMSAMTDYQMLVVTERLDGEFYQEPSSEHLFIFVATYEVEKQNTQN